MINNFFAEFIYGSFELSIVDDCEWNACGLTRPQVKSLSILFGQGYFI